MSDPPQDPDSPVELPEPESQTAVTRRKKLDLLWRGLSTVVFFVLFAVAETVLFVLAVIQFFWMLLSAGKSSEAIAEFGISLGKWLNAVALFQTGQSDERPFPWKETEG